MIIVAGHDVYEAMQREKATLVAENERGFNSDQLCALQHRQAGRGLVGACIVKSIYGYSVRYDSGLRDFALIRSTRGLPEHERTFEAAVHFCEEWCADDPEHRYAWHSEVFGITVEAVKSVAGTTVYEVQHNGQALSEPWMSRREAEWQRDQFAKVKGRDDDPLASYWARVIE